MLFVVVLLFVLVAAGEAVDCSKYKRDACVAPRPIRVLFVVDASLSIGNDKFGGDLADYLVEVYCSFSDDGGGTIEYEAGLMTFNQYQNVLIPFGVFTPDTWEQEINRKVRNNVPLRCCTSHAEAAILAKELFSDPTLRDGFENIAFFVTDGGPFANWYDNAQLDGVALNPESLAFYTDRGLDPMNFTRLERFSEAENDEFNARYAAYNVPYYVNQLLKEDLRLFFIGIPPKGKLELNIGYFNGSDSEICFGSSCEQISIRPLVSEPVSDYAFSAPVWDVTYLVQSSLNLICEKWVPPSKGGVLCNDLQGIVPAQVLNNCELMKLQPFGECCPGIAYQFAGEGRNRSLELLGSWCDESVRDCNRFRTKKDLLDIYINQSFTTTETCGYACTAYGDPQIISFSGAKEEWTICDGRDPTEKFCNIREDVCKAKTDHNGNPCLWDGYVASRTNDRWKYIQVYGSPCLPDFAQGPAPQMNLYSVSQFSGRFSMDLDMDERGTIGAVSILANGVTHTLDANDCINDPSVDAWTSTSGSIPSSFVFVGEKFTDEKPHRIYENTWKVGDRSTGIIAEI